MAVAVIHGWHSFSCTVATGRAVPFSTVLKDVMNDGQTESLAASIRSFGCAKYI